MRIAHGVLILTGMLAACVDDPVTGPPIATELQVVSGGNQQGTPGYRLENEVVVRLLDERGNGVAGATIAFSSEDQYAVTEPATVVTDSTGVARAWWRLGATIGAQELAARYEALPSAKLRATATSLTVRNVTGGVNRFCVLDLPGPSPADGARRSVRPILPHIPAPGNLRFTEFVVGGGYLGCGVTEAGRIWCLALSDIQNPFASFQELAGNYPPLHGLSTPTLGIQGFCGLSAAGQGYCWGANTENRFAQTVGVNPTTPTPIGTSQPFASILLGRWSACALTADGTPWCWGGNARSLSGQPSGVGESRVDPAPMQTSLKFSKVTLDSDALTGCGFATTGGFWCWGAGYPQLRVGTLDTMVGHVPQRVPAFDGLRDATAGTYRLLSLHGNSSTATTVIGFEERGSVVFRAGDFGGNQLRTFLNGPFIDVVCGKVEVLGGTLCRSVWEQIRPFSNFPEEPAVGAFGIPPRSAPMLTRLLDHLIWADRRTAEALATLPSPTPTCSAALWPRARRRGGVAGPDCRPER